MPPRDSAVYPMAELYSYQRLERASVVGAARGQRIEGDIYASQGSLGNLTIRGTARIAEQGSISSGMSNYGQGSGFWMGNDNGTPKFSIGTEGGDMMTWDGSSLDVSGTASIDSGQIGGWTINASDLTGGDAVLHSTGYLRLGTASNIVQMSGVDATWRLWAGASAATSAPFRVDRFGALTASSSTITGTLTSSNLTATGGQIGGWNITTSAIELGSAGTKRGIDSGSTAFYAGSSTPASAPFRVTTAGALTATSATITGAVDATSGSLSNLTITGTLTLSGASAKIVDSDGSEWNKDGIILVSVGSFGDAIKWRRSGTDVGSIYATGTTTLRLATLAGTAMDLTTNGWQIYSNLTDGFLVSSGNVATIVGGNDYMDVGGADRRVNFYGRIYPGTGTASQSNVYFHRSGNEFRATLGDTAGAYSFNITDSAGQTQLGVSSNGGLIYPDADSTALGSYAGRIPIYVNGLLRYLPYYN